MRRIFSSDEIVVSLIRRTGVRRDKVRARRNDGLDLIVDRFRRQAARYG